MKNFSSAFLTTLIIALTLSCKDEITKPEEQLKSPLEMIWTADTIAFPGSPQTNLTQLWAFSPKDIYAVGWCSYVGGEMYHFDGTKWTAVDVATYIGGHRINRIFGATPNNIWAVGYEGKHNLIAHYDGIKWVKEDIFTNGYLYWIDGESPKNIYACGKRGIVYYYDGTGWNYDQIIPPGSTEENFELYSVAVVKGEVFLVGRKVSSPTIHKEYLFHGKYQNWKMIDSMDFSEGVVKPKWGFLKLIKGTNGKLYSCAPNDLFVWNGAKWDLLPENNVGGNGFFAFKDNYMIALANDIDYYDGIRWQLMPKLLKDYSNIFFSSAWSDGKEMFILASLGFSFEINVSTIIFHGK